MIKEEVIIEAINNKDHSGIKFNDEWYNGKPELLKEIEKGDKVTFQHDEQNKIMAVTKIEKPKLNNEGYWILRLKRDIDNDKFYKDIKKKELAIKILELIGNKYTTKEIIEKINEIKTQIWKWYSENGTTHKIDIDEIYKWEMKHIK